MVVCNAHMHWDPEYSDVKMIQSFLLTTELDRIIRLHNRQPHEMPGSYKLAFFESLQNLSSDYVWGLQFVAGEWRGRVYSTG